MRQKLKLYLISALLILTALPSGADSRCPPVPDTAKKDEFLVDLANGGPVGKTSFKLKDKVRIVFVNRNPFLRYDVKIEDTEVANPALTTFTGLFDLFALLKTTGAAPAPSTPTDRTELNREAGRAFAERGDACWKAVTDAGDFLAQASQSILQLNQSATELDSRLSTLKTVFSTSQEILESPTVACETLQNTGSRLHAALQTADLDKPWSAYKNAYDSLFSPDASGAILTAKIDRALMAADAVCKQAPADARDQLAALKGARSNLLSDARIQEISKQKSVLDTLIRDINSKETEIQTILSEPASFIFYRSVGPFDVPTDVEISIRTKKPSDKDFAKDPDFSFVLNFGGPSRFTLSIGIAASRLHTVEYEAVQGFPLDANGKPSTTPVSVVGLKDSSNQRITPMLMLNTRLTRGYGIMSGVHFSFGISGKVDNKGTDVEYLSGFSFGFAENNVFLTLGAYNGRVQKLNQGFSVNTPLGTVPQPPVHKDRSWKPMIAISFKVR